MHLTPDLTLSYRRMNYKEWIWLYKERVGMGKCILKGNYPDFSSPAKWSIFKLNASRSLSSQEQVKALLRKRAWYRAKTSFQTSFLCLQAWPCPKQMIQAGNTLELGSTVPPAMDPWTPTFTLRLCFFLKNCAFSGQCMPSFFTNNSI